MIQVVLLNLIQVDILLTDRWMQGVLDSIGLKEPIKQEEDESLVEAKPYNYFYDQGYKVNYFLGNLGSSLVFLIATPLIYFFIGVIHLLGKCFLLCLRLSRFLNSLFVWDFIFGFYFSQFTPIVLACLINLTDT